MKDFLLETFPNPERIGCPYEKVLQALAEGQLPADETVRFHVGSCSECYAEYRHYRQDWLEEQQARTAGTDPLDTPATPSTVRGIRRGSNWGPITRMSVAASLLIVCSASYVAYSHFHLAPPPVDVASSAPVDATVDLFSNGTSRGTEAEAMPLQQVSLPAVIVHLSVVLPRFSETGSYTVNVASDKHGAQLVATGTGEATERNEGKVTVSVALDLRAAKPGDYFLAIVRGTDNGTYYYPLKIK